MCNNLKTYLYDPTIPYIYFLLLTLTKLKKLDNFVEDDRG